MSDIKVYLTSLEPNLSQSNDSQSIGGYISNTLVYPETSLAETIGLYDMTLTLDNWTGLSGLSYLNINNEIIKVGSISSNNITILQRGINGILNVHVRGDDVRGISLDRIYNNVFNENYKQYRCFAVKNIPAYSDPSTILTAFNMSAYIFQNSNNVNSSFKMAIEVPKHQYRTGTSTSWTSMTLTDSSLVSESLEDNIFSNAYLRILDGPNVGMGRVVSSFDASTGIFVFSDAFPFSESTYIPEVGYEIEPNPAQRVKTGTESPVVNTDLVSSFSQPSESYPLNINIGKSANSSHLYSNDVIYIWVEREVKKGSPDFEENSLIFNFNYFTSI